MAVTIQATGVHRPDKGAAGPDAQPRESTPGPAATTTAPPEAALDLHKGIAPRSTEGGCPRWPESLRLESTLGQLVPGRCKATNLCDYCAKLAAVENSEVLAQDALCNSAPAVWLVLTTRSTVATMSAYREAMRSVRRAIRRGWPSAELATLVEFTTGMGTRSKGERRPHWNILVKGVLPADLDALRLAAATAWCSRVDALPEGQYAGEVAKVGGLMRYLALHFQKESQQPPKGWRGHRFTTTRGYLAEPMENARERARTALRWRRELWKVQQALGDVMAVDELAELADASCAARAELGWSLVRVQAVPTAFDGDGQPTDWAPITYTVRA